jgi:hypothetical protein
MLREVNHESASWSGDSEIQRECDGASSAEVVSVDEVHVCTVARHQARQWQTGDSGTERK